ncbi:MAG: hypothetical protein ACXV3C_12250 [Actinomycetes bacterium]
MTDTTTEIRTAPALKRRNGLVWTLIVLAAVIALVSSLTVWVKRQALDTDAWTKASNELLQNDQVREALSVYIVDQLYTNGDVSGRLQQDLPPNLAGLAGPLAGALRAPAVDAVDRLLARPRVQTLWERVNRVAHQQLVAILNGNPRPNVSTANGTVVLDLRSFIVDVGGQLGIGDQLDQKLPANVGQVTVLESGQLKTAQDVVKGIKALSWLLGILTFLLWGLALWQARGWRRVALRGIGASLLVIGVLLLVIRRLAGNYVVDALTTGGTVRDAANSTWLIATTLLATIGWAAIIYGIVVVAGAWLAGPSKPALATRNRMAPVLVDRPGLAWTILGGVFLLIVWWGPTPALHNVLGVIVLGALAAAGFEVLRRIVVAEQAEEAEAPAAPVTPPIPAARQTQP